MSLSSASPVTRRRFLLFAVEGVAAGLSLTTLAGCGGGGGSSQSSSATSKSKPTAVTRSRVQTMLGTGARQLTQFAGASTGVSAINGLAYGGFSASNTALAVDSGGGAATPTAASTASGSVPLLGAFLQNVAAVPRTSRARAIHRARKPRRDQSVDPTPPSTTEPVDPNQPVILASPTFYYDYYLGLWVDITDTTTTTTYALYQDEAKTQPAGSIVTTQPADWAVYPQDYSSTYSFTAGYLAGSHGSSDDKTAADGSGSSQYNNTYADGWTDSGASSWDGRGDYSWQSSSTSSTGQTTQARGAFYTNGSGGSHMSTSDGYTADYVYNADGSGHGTITGPDPGLPVTASWDAYGNTTIRYADGTVETFSGYGYGYGGGDGSGGGVVPVDTGTTTTGTTATTTAVPSPPATF